MKRFINGFGWAARGLATAFREERNLRFQLCVAVYVLLFSRFYQLSRLQYVALVIVIAGVLALELVNSAIERVVDRLSPGANKHAGVVKDIAAGAVLVFSIGAAACGVLLFWDVAVFRAIFAWFAARPAFIALLAASLAFCGWLVFGWGRTKAPKNDESKPETDGEQLG